MNIQESYNLWAASYDSDLNFTRDLDEQILQGTLANRPGRITLEIGCGTGKNTRFLSQASDEVLAIDFSEAMLHQAKEKLDTSNVRFCLANLTHRWPIQPASVDRIVCDLVLEHIEDLSHIFLEARRCLRKGGYFYISELHPFRQYQGTKARFQQGSDQIEVDAFVHHTSDYFNAAKASGLVLEDLHEWWHTQDQNKLPRLVTFVFAKPRHA